MKGTYYVMIFTSTSATRTRSRDAGCPRPALGSGAFAPVPPIFVPCVVPSVHYDYQHRLTQKGPPAVLPRAPVSHDSCPCVPSPCRSHTGPATAAATLARHAQRSNACRSSTTVHSPRLLTNARPKMRSLCASDGTSALGAASNIASEEPRTSQKDCVNRSAAGGIRCRSQQWEPADPACMPSVRDWRGHGVGRRGSSTRGMSTYLADALRETATNHGIERVVNGSLDSVGVVSVRNDGFSDYPVLTGCAWLCPAARLRSRSRSACRPP